MFPSESKQHRKRTLEPSVYTLINNRAEGGRGENIVRKGRKEDGEGKVGRGVVEKGRVINEHGCDKGDGEGRKIMRFSRERDELWKVSNEEGRN